ncbi:MAG: hypothetical protein A3K19_21260 [Lentisphaerae bacterium RIFOXYB12_FULL_65_16]|nr:MAG: hypothetical protein A3K18_33935 [Lentisphaerae bacterium RIFOXYA12_64_32]OGV93661.1 MAG: hypothetical protein A3K19_21260 [Lentisphaerae bacterium RIFOXYB12_FULL_65_16]
MDNTPDNPKPRPRLPPWLRVPFRGGRPRAEVRGLLKSLDLHTVCQSADCPNLCECWARRTATFMILGDVCTRNCRFCAVAHGKPAPPDPEEPAHVAEAAARLDLRFVVVTSVTRDDLPDGGAAHFAATVRAVRARLPDAGIEVLTPDFGAREADIRTVIDTHPTVFNHNIETCARLSLLVRPQADYARSLRTLATAARLAAEAEGKGHGVMGVEQELRGTGAEAVERPGAVQSGGTGSVPLAPERDAPTTLREGQSNTPVGAPHAPGGRGACHGVASARSQVTQIKSGLMLGMGETPAEVRAVFADLRAAGVQSLTVGQYLPPSRQHWPVERYVTPAEFADWGEIARREFGFEHVVSAPLVRSSYMADQAAAAAAAAAGALPPHPHQRGPVPSGHPE